MRTNVAKGFVDYYETDDYKQIYHELLFETFSQNEREIVERILNLFNNSNYEINVYFERNYVLDYAKAKEIYDFISKNIERFTADFNGFFVGGTSLESVTFGEQEEPLTGIRNHKTGREYTLPYLRKIFDKEYFYVRGNYAYYNLEKGLHVELCNCKDEINAILKT